MRPLDYPPYRRVATEDAASTEIVYDFREATLNNLGYRLLGEGRIEAALAMLELNAERFPESANVWDSVGEARFAAGDLAAARSAYERAIAIDFTSGNARRKLREIADRTPGA